MKETVFYFRKGLFLWLLSLAVMMLPLSATAQPVEYSYANESSVRNAFLVMMNGGARLSPTVYYDVFNSSYQKYAYLNPLLGPRSIEMNLLYLQQPVAEKLDSSLKVRAKQEEKYMLDRQPYLDASWALERQKVTAAMNTYKANIGKITLEGGTDQQAWVDKWNALQEGIQALQDAYMPMAERHKQYLETLKEARRQNSELVTYLYALHCYKKVISSYEEAVKAPKRTDVRSVGAYALGRWKYSIGLVKDSQ